ncbi:PelD GGDEF domain-containing protein [Atopomonas sediminilitoris]|uniref:PelD GGDEF domain-containing protein n=1 Tax=Atopomonas sediminilitoris TaxID=2919919 RepID=UPI001F4E5BF7|nr:PelD GGDEF domain-containing protein [Atopomonas sediminilitoris]MCJ8168927.1 sugar transporter [Atopomonas sediminilitoris]
MQDYLRIAPRQIGNAAWVETLALTVIVVALGYWSEPTDPLHAFTGFPWSLFAPVLLGLRYGFVQGLISALMLLAVLLGMHRFELGAYANVPAAYVVGLFACAMLVGEFRDLWDRRLEGLQRANEYRQLRLDEFTRAHHILRISHDRLEQKIAGNDQSLRSALLAMRQRLNEVQGQDGLSAMAESMLDVLAHYGPLRVAALYRVSEMQLVDQPLASLGELSAADLRQDPMVGLMLERRELISIRPDMIDAGSRLEHSTLLACLPLIDTNGELHAMVAIENMPFFAFHERNLNLLAILGGHLADILSSREQEALHIDVAAARFNRYLSRSITDARQYEVPATLVAFEMLDPAWFAALQQLMQSTQRGLDVLRTCTNTKQSQVVLALLPLTAEDGAEGYLQRIRLSVQEQFGRTPEEVGLALHRIAITSRVRQSSIERFLLSECALDEHEVAIH